MSVSASVDITRQIVEYKSLITITIYLKILNLYISLQITNHNKKKPNKQKCTTEHTISEAL